MKRKNTVYIKKSFIYLFIFSLFYNISINSAECPGLIQQVEALLDQQVLFNQSLQRISALQDQMNADFESIVEILAGDKSMSMPFDQYNKIPTKATSESNLGRSNSAVIVSNNILFDINGNQITTVQKLRDIITSQFSSIDSFAEMHEKMDETIDLLGTATGLADELSASVSDCESELDDCVRSCVLWKKYMDEIDGVSDGISQVNIIFE